jgi:phosphoribosyl-AMP cyclohydrolase
MANWKYGPIRCSEDWGLEYKDVDYSICYNTTSDILSIIRKDNKEEIILQLGYDESKAVAQMMTEWYYHYIGDKFLKELINK